MIAGKTGFYDQSFHVPLIVRDPRAAADAHRGKRFAGGFTEAVDIMPTLLDYAGVTIPTQCDGSSLLSVVHSGEFPHARGWRTAAFYECAVSLFLVRCIRRSHKLFHIKSLT